MERLLFECAIRSTLIIAAAGAVLAVMRIKNVVAEGRKNKHVSQ